MRPYKYIPPDDAKICQEIKNNNPNTWFEDMLYIKYRDLLFEYGKTKCNNKEKAEDIAQDLVQEVIIISLEKIRDGKFKSKHEGHILNYMKKTFTNQLSNLRRKKKRLPTISENNIPIPDFLAEEEKEEKIPYLEIVREELKKLDEKCQELLIDFYYKKLSMQELEKLFSFVSNEKSLSSEKNARQYRHKCVKILRYNANERLKDY